MNLRFWVWSSSPDTPITITPSPVTVPLTTPAVILLMDVIVTPSPVTMPIATPAVVVGIVVLVDPVTMPIATPSVVVSMVVLPSPVTIPIVVPAPLVSIVVLPSPVVVYLLPFPITINPQPVPFVPYGTTQVSIFQNANLSSQVATGGVVGGQVVVQNAECKFDEITEILNGGDEHASFTYKDTKLPPRYSHVELRDGRGVWWQGRVVRRSWSSKTNEVKVEAQGYASSFNDRRFSGGEFSSPDSYVISFAEFTRGPASPPNKTFFNKGTPIHEAVQRAIASKAPYVDNLQLVSNTGFTLLDDSDDFQGHTVLDVINYMVGLTSVSTTPVVWQVRPYLDRPTFEWKPLDLFPHFDINALDPSVCDSITLDDDADKVFNESIAEWGNNQTVIETEFSPYTLIPIFRTKYINASDAVRNIQDARGIASAYFGKHFAFEDPGWSGTITIKKGVEVQDNLSGEMIPNYRVRPCRFIRILNLQQLMRDRGIIGINDRLPTKWLILNTSYNGTDVVVHFGADLNPALALSIRNLIAATRNMFHGTHSAAFNPGDLDADKLTVFGPPFPTNSAGKPPLEVGLPVFDRSRHKIMPELVPERFLAATIDDYIPGGGIAVGIKPPVGVVSSVITYAELESSSAGTVRVRLLRNTPDNTISGPFLDMTLGAGSTFINKTFKPIRFGPKDRVYLEVVDIDQTIEWISIRLYGEQDYPGWPFVTL